MTDILRLFFIILLLIAAITAYFVVLNALFENRVTKTQRAIIAMPARSFGVGLVNFLFFGVIAVVLLSLTDANRVSNVMRVILLFPTVAVLVFLGILLTFGLAGMVNIIGERIFPDHAVLKQKALGAVILCIACALPILGWFLLLPYVGFVGIGGFILGLFQRDL